MTKKVISWLVILLLPIMIFASNGDKVSGLVVNKVTGEPLIGANVIIEGLNIGSATNMDGFFSFSFDVEESFVLVVSYMGYKTTEVECTPDRDLTNLEIRMTEDILMSEKVVITGIGSKTSREIAPVAVASVAAQELTESMSYTSVSQLLNGKVAGATLSTSSGNVGAGYSFNVRSGGGINGNGQPVIYVDGIRVNNSELEGYFAKGGQQLSALTTLDPSEIANIEILKGPASAASYGTDGSNGVVLITTKRGNLAVGGRGFKVNYKYQTGMNQQSYKYTKDDILTYKDANGIFRDGQVEGHNLQISGGNSAVRYFFALGQRNEEGIVGNNSMDRKNIRLNVDAIATDNLTFSVTTSFAETVTERPENDNNIYGWLGNTVLRTSAYGWLDSLSIARTDDDNNMKSFTGSIKATYEPVKNLTANLSVGVDNLNMRTIAYYPPDGGYLYDTGSRQIYNRNNIQYTYDMDLGYKANITADLSLDTRIGTQIFDRDMRSSWVQADSLSNIKIKDIESAAIMKDYGENYFTERKAGVYFNNSMNYQNRLFLGANIRQDFCSSLSDKAPNIFYPSFNAAIRLDKFGLAPSFMDLAKLRIAYGETGQLPDATDAIRLIWAAEQSGYGPGGTINQIGNEEIEPERIKELELGLDLNMFNRFGIEMTYAKMNAENSIVGRDLAPSTGLTASALPVNVGKVEGWAFELSFNGRLIDKKNLKLDFTQLNSWQDNEVTKLAEPIYSAFDMQVIQEGYRKYTFLGVEVDSIIYGDDGKYERYTLTDEEQDLGSGIPFYNGSFALDLTLFKNVQVRALIDWRYKFKVYNYTKIYQTYFGNNQDYNNAISMKDSLEAIDGYDYSSSKYKNAVDDYVQYSSLFGGSDAGFVEDGDFIKFREISISYNATSFLHNLTKHSGINKIYFAFSANNIATWTKYSGPDPDVNMSGANDGDKGLDFMTLQHPKSYTFTIQLGL